MAGVDFKRSFATATRINNVCLFAKLFIRCLVINGRKYNIALL